MFDSNFFRDLGEKVKEEYRKYIFVKGKDVYGKDFKQYKEPYKSRKREGKFKRQESTKTLPVLTGDLYRDLAVSKPSSTGFFIGWNVWGAKVISLNKQGRELTTKDKPLPDSVVRFMDKKLEKNIYKKHIKPNCKTTKHMIGK